MEDSSSSEPPLCPCGFWGSAKTLGLCSKCYHDYIKTSSDALECTDVGGSQVASAQNKAGQSSKMDSNSKHCPHSSADNIGKQPTCGEDKKDPNTLPASCASSSAAEVRTPSPVSEAAHNRQSSGAYASEEVAASMTDSAVLGVKGKEESVQSSSHTVEWTRGEPSPRPSDLSITSCGPSSSVARESDSHERLSCAVASSSHVVSTDTDQASSRKKTSEVVAPNENAASPQGTKRSHDEMESGEASSINQSKQKNKKRCYKCSMKLELAHRELGRCRCEKVFCSLHRHPEAHNCEFDHKEDGRREARERMVKPTRHLGPSFHRLDKS